LGADFSISVRFFRLSDALQPYFTALYHFEFDCPGGTYIPDYLHPEWTVMRLTRGAPPIATIGPGPLRKQWPLVVSGPTSRSIRFGITTSSVFGLGLQPAGWARFVAGRACDFADRTIDGETDPAFRLFAPLLAMAQEPYTLPDGVAGRINDYLMGCLGPAPRQEGEIRALHEALLDSEIGSVEQLSQRLGIGRRSLERLCARYFGFPPKLLLRRQRFLRSLAQFMLDPQTSWSEALDGQYYDQAQFVRDFRSFMGMTPSEYADMPHPILDKIMAQRMADQGAAPQTDLPTLLRYTGQNSE
jgi:AraC-like DNA-binding protein